MNDDWRLRIDLSDGGRANELTRELAAQTLDGETERSLHDRVVVSTDGGEVFCYAGTREQAEAARQAIMRLAANHAWKIEPQLKHWHPTAERWEDPDAPLPSSDAELTAERGERLAQERSDAVAQGYPDFEVRIQCGSRHEAGELAERLETEGIPLVHRWSTVLVGAADEDSAGQLAERIRTQAPAGSTVTVEGNLRAVYNERPWRPFSVLGGMGG